MKCEMPMRKKLLKQTYNLINIGNKTSLQQVSTLGMNPAVE